MLMSLHLCSASTDLQKEKGIQTVFDFDKANKENVDYILDQMSKKYSQSFDKKVITASQ